MASVSQRPLRLRSTDIITAALERGGAVVALESSVLAQGLTPPFNRVAAARMMRAVEQAGAIPAITAIVRGEPSLGLEADDLERFLARDGVRKVSARDLGIAMADGADGATTVAATLAASIQSCRVEQYSSSSSSSQFFIKSPITSKPCCFKSQAVTDESTPPDIPTTTLEG